MANKKQSKEKAEKPKVKWYKRSHPKVEQVFHLFAVASISWMSYIVLTGLDDELRFILSAPAIAWAALTLIRQAVK